MPCLDSPLFFEYRARKLRMERTLGNTTCSKGHVHPPWNTTGLLRIAKCESVCGFCQKETKTAANLRKHVAIHIKNEALNLTIAEGSSGRGRLEITHALERDSSLSHISQLSSSDSDSNASRSNASPPCPQHTLPSTPESFSPSAVLMSMHAHHHQPQHVHPGMQSNSRASYPTATASAALMLPHAHPNTPLPFSYPYTTHSNSAPVPGLSNSSYVGAMPNTNTNINALYAPHTNDPFRPLRERKIHTKTAWTVIPATEGYAIMEFCKSQSVAQPVSVSVSPTTGTSTSTGMFSHEGIAGSSSRAGSRGGGASTMRTPCYNRETLFDEEWMAHIRDVHGICCLWPETWIRRIEVLDLEPFGGDIGGIGELMEGT
ncbi:hypothetical protein LSUB1_G008047 [Lachnellula subtilissima]|uniref:Uncharacterized protein n=1 Tax=Lachnellula subtilissima TaxID=602034 RepID=A0A8H8RH98_9HELO|nr:hypothetical protein LSUB1_G008047 [Lachnellula subtilissima]